ncbi:putative disease resistance protein RGA1 isoform X1 [Rosa rugosa]|uniref:putative disease resistance protein RGA1 isoform X1 n=2 Tax=Rosa rugosa TaxID=74645 RepID=UPI002B40330F|nr:putative disease resistance protein RGA1 isoform X1 [Rosa rugosa]
MADWVLSPALQVIFDRIASPVIEKFADLWDFKDNLQSLKETLMLIQPTLEDAEEQQFCNKAVKIWLSKLEKAAYDAEDELHYLNAKGMIRINCVQLLDLKTASYIKEMLQALETTVNEGLIKFTFTRPNMVDRRSSVWETSSFVIKSQIYGRDDDKDKVVKLLLSSQAYQEGYASCIAIVGIGGIGKTTLAQLAYNDERVIQNFDVRVWIYVSDDFNVKKIMKTIIESVTNDECRFSDIELLQSQLWRLLHNKRYLLVLDDVWTSHHNDWDKLKPLFRGGVDGCKVIVTTRNTKTALMTDSPNSPFYLKGLEEEDCWALFKQQAFGRGEEEKYPHLLPIGKQIVRKCGGVPLAAKSLGSIMRFKRSQQQWLSVQNTELWKLDVCELDILPALMLSYFYLPFHLRRCFTFCSIFPKGYEFNKHKLIHMWMAEGLLLEDASKRPENVGDDYFTNLLWMSFFQEVDRCDGGGVIWYKMNDVIHDLSQYVAGNTTMILENGFQPKNLEKIRHSSVVYRYRAITIPQALYEAKHLRSLLFIGESGLIKDFLYRISSSFEYLRTLDVNSCDVHELPYSVCRLICLRYLDLSYTPISTLPDFMAWKLASLQTLNLLGCPNLRRLPALGGMTGLRHLDITACASLTQMPKGIGELHQLETLPLYVISYNGEAHELGGLNLYGRLNLTHLENVTKAVEAKSAGLRMKENIESLGLYWRGEDVDESIMVKLPKAQQEAVISGSQRVPQNSDPVEEILQSLKPHDNLKMLVINGYPGTRLPDWTLPNLTAVYLKECRNCQNLPALGNLLMLKTLSLQGMDSLKHVGADFYGDGTSIPFSSLQELSLCDLSNLEEWSSANNMTSFPRLRKLTVNRCPKLAHIPLSESLQHLELRGCKLRLMSIANLSLLSVLVLENIPDLSSLPQGLIASAHLSCLKILSCPKLRSLPLEMGNCLTSLKSLTIGWCQDLSSLPESLQNLKALESLEISDCHYIISMPDGAIGGLSSLRTLSIENCTSLTSLSSSLEHLTFLEHLTIMYCPSLDSFPEGVQHLSALRSLTILSCPWFDSLPNGLQNVRTLHCLEISSCTNLRALPEWFENLDSLRSLTISACPNLEELPAGLKHLTKLQYLSIQECPELEQRCRQGNGEDWFKIAHVPHKYIGSPQVSQSSEASTSGGSSSQTSAHGMSN